MKQITLLRKRTGDQGTFGELDLDGLTLYTGELPWRDNQPTISSIPAGTYVCKWQFSEKFRRNVYHLQNVPGRSFVEIHPGNVVGDTAKGFESDVAGCICLGLSEGEVRGQEAVLHSKDAVKQFEQELDGEDFELKIIDEYAEAGDPAGHPFS